MLPYLLALVVGVIAGLRAMTAPAAVSWAAYLGKLQLGGTWLAFLGGAYTAWVFTALALVELGTDQLPNIPSRKVPVQFGTRILTGGLSGAAVGASSSWMIGLALGVIGAVIGTFGGAEGRRRLGLALGKDLPAALIEDAVAVCGALAIVTMLG